MSQTTATLVERAAALVPMLRERAAAAEQNRRVSPVRHAIMHPQTAVELYGRVLCGLEPNTLLY